MKFLQILSTLFLVLIFSNVEAQELAKTENTSLKNTRKWMVISTRPIQPFSGFKTLGIEQQITRNISAKVDFRKGGRKYPTGYTKNRSFKIGPNFYLRSRKSSNSKPQGFFVHPFYSVEDYEFDERRSELSGFVPLDLWFVTIALPEFTTYKIVQTGTTREYGAFIGYQQIIANFFSVGLAVGAANKSKDYEVKKFLEGEKIRTTAETYKTKSSGHKIEFSIGVAF